ncbi:KAP family P-loop NTPase fold protein [Priestia megaterium]|uniref:KAP family P-loop NTPase fold protein n=1 Tax=Priestia megaterium TaxID=1404 RepID=UPI001CD1FD52|nr:P-loop NTPase fold protein [Priestia megaterium]
MSNHPRRTSIVDIPRLSKDVKDYFGIDKYSEGLADFIRHSDTPITIAVQGEWGSGKTSLMNHVHNELCGKEKEFESIWINTWEYSVLIQDRDTLLTVISNMLNATVKAVEESLEQVDTSTKETKSGKIKAIERSLTKIKDFSRNLAPIMPELAKLGIAHLLGGDMLTPETINQIFSNFQQNKSDQDNNIQGELQQEVHNHLSPNIMELKRSLESVISNSLEINKNKKGFVFFIDDLDRLEPSVAVDILEVLKNVFTIDKCIFLLAIDYDVVVKGLKSKFGEKDNSNEKEFRSFFDKIIQVPFTMPVNSYDINKFLADHLEGIFYFEGFEKKKIDLESFQEKAVEVVQLSVGTNPRSLKRLINSLSLLKIINNRIEKYMISENEEIVHFALICIQTAYPKIYELLNQEPYFTRWDEDTVLGFLGKRLDDNVRKKEIDPEDNSKWEKILNYICDEISLSSKVQQIIDILNIILEEVPDGEDLDKFMKRMLSMTAITDVSNVSSQKDVSGLRIGMYVRQTLLDLIKKGLIEDNMIEQLLTKEYSKQTFGLGYPFFKEYDKETSIRDLARHEGDSRNRYWTKTTFKINGKKYIACSEWYNHMYDNFENWKNVLISNKRESHNSNFPKEKTFN